MGHGREHEGDDDSDPKQVLIVAESFKRAESWAGEEGLDKKRWKYVSGVDAVAGRANYRVVYVGEWFKRIDAKEVSEAIRQHLYCGNAEHYHG